MSLDQEQARTLDPKKAGLPDIDTDAEHDRGTARKASNASLKREGASRGGGGAPVTAAPAPSKSDLHTKAERSSFDTVQDELKHYAHALHTWWPELKDLASPTRAKDTVRNDAPAQQRVLQILSDATAGASRVKSLVAAVAVNDRKFLAPELQMVLGGYDRFLPWMTKATQWLDSQGDHGHNPSGLTAIIGSLDDTYGFSPGALQSDANDPTSAANSKGVIGAEIAAAEAAFESVKGGNGEDASRVALHIKALQSHHDQNPAAFAAHRVAIKKLLKHVDEIKSKFPELAAWRNALLELLK